MKYVVLSFDDGFADFKENALPLLKKHNIKASINIVSGFSDKSIKSNREYLTVSDIRSLYLDGFEIANHSNSHLKITNLTDFEACKIKLQSWIGSSCLGAIIPYSQKVDENLFSYFSNNGYLYIADYSHHKTKRSAHLFFKRIINKFFRSEFGNFLVSSQYYIYNKRCFVSGVIPFFSRFPINKEIPPEYLIKFIKYMGDNQCLTIVFHSIIKNTDDEVEWPRGAWTTSQLDALLGYLKKDKKIVVTTQRELIEELNNEI